MRKATLIRAILSPAALALTLALGACGGDDGDGVAEAGDGTKKLVIYANSYSKEIPFFRDLHDGIKLRAEQLGWEVTSEFANNTPEQQVEQIENAMTRQPDVMLITPINPEALEPPIRKAVEGGITVAAVGNTIENRQLLLSSMLFDNEDIGRKKAEFLVERLGGKGKVAIVHGIRGLTFTEGQRKGAQEVFDRNRDIEIVARAFAGGFSSDLGLKETQDILTRTPDVDAIFFDNDDLAIGGIQALRERSISLEDVVLAGTDGAQPGLDAVRKGELDYTLSACGVANGILSVNVVNDFLERDKKPPELVRYKVEEFTPANIEDKLRTIGREDCR